MGGRTAHPPPSLQTTARARSLFANTVKSFPHGARLIPAAPTFTSPLRKRLSHIRELQEKQTGGFPGFRAALGDEGRWQAGLHHFVPHRLVTPNRLAAQQVSRVFRPHSGIDFRLTGDVFTGRAAARVGPCRVRYPSHVCCAFSCRRGQVNSVIDEGVERE